ncbi:hypothetical protein HELRODRAFT_170789 [Helobdella robusta]|uniref:Uncharacterized protein n=1 Tax=Helobdella robusta TaxID=6412 RepID=T1F3F3_HELRO|nr:hypothetical protein HELRODRAFT_170789 [Helobdella robusta]ESO06774.1 hypothetical protein HELRODRAFT_170789 [Helobdella robusta]
MYKFFKLCIETIVATMITLRDLNSPIRIMHRTKGGKIFSLTLSSLYSSFSPSSSHKQNDENEKAWVKLSSSSKIIYLDKLSDDNYLFQTLKTIHGGIKSGKPVSNSPPRLLEWFFSKSADLENDGSRKGDSVNIILLWHSMAAEHFNKQQLSKTSSHQPQQQQPPPLQPQHIDDIEDSNNVRLALNELKFPGLSMDVISLSMAFHSSFPFKQSLHSAVESLAAKGTLQELNRRWSSSAAPSHPHRDDEDDDEDDVGDSDDDTSDMKSGVASFTIGLCMLHCFILLLIVLCSSLHYYKMKLRQSLLDEMESDDAQESSSAAVKSSNNNVEAPITTATTTTAAEFSRSLDSLPTTSNSADQLQRIRNSNFFDDRIDEFDFANNYFQDKEEHQLFQMPPCLSHPYHHHHHFHDYHSTHPHHFATNYFERHQFPKVAYDSIDSERSDSRMHLTQKRRQYRTTQPHQFQQKLRLQQQQQQRQYHTLADRRSENSQQQKSTTSTISRPHKCKAVKGVQCQDDSGSRSSSFPLWRRQTNIF